MDTKMTKRIWELDFFRGFAIIMMVFDHLMFDLMLMPSWFSNYAQVDHEFIKSLHALGVMYWNSDLRAGGHYVFVGLFLFISGISFNMSKNNFIRGLKFLIFALLISAVTISAEIISSGAMRFATYFGIIHLYAVGTLLTYLIRKIWNNDIFMLVIGCAILAIGLHFRIQNNPYYDRLTFGRFFLMMFGYRGFGADYFPIAPFAGAIMIGSALGRWMYPNKQSLLPGLARKWSAPVNWAGRKAFVIFVLHQVVLFVVILGVMYLLGYRI
ncbi:MAG: heparan-alpha-glucosaminide N-acetyltransferase domain-containing protein [Candidatus Izemoplasmatales bacterium]|nr:heparan-alpha-glucosaminide N-acetyltransferase domain-containing protein [Candidatus Izemoplasmatales bacterium]